MRFAILACLLAIPPLSAQGQESVTFEKDIEPILARAGCNSGPCHGKSRGQNGFQLSLLGYDPQFDFQAIVSEARGRRIFAAAPEQSLFLTKPAGLVPHGGSKKLRIGERDYNVPLNWIRGGMPRTPASEPKLERIHVEPNERTLHARETFQLVVTAHYSDGPNARRHTLDHVPIERERVGGRRRRGQSRRGSGKDLKTSTLRIEGLDKPFNGPVRLYVRSAGQPESQVRGSEWSLPYLWIAAADLKK